MHARDRQLRAGAPVDLATRTFRSEGPVHGVVDTGSIDYDAVFRMSSDVGFMGWISSEDGDEPANGLQHLQEFARFLRRLTDRNGVGWPSAPR